MPGPKTEHPLGTDEKLRPYNAWEWEFIPPRPDSAPGGGESIPRALSPNLENL
jgi:hypothetical protein